MACPHCGERLPHKREGRLRCCRCDRLWHGAGAPFEGLRRHGLLLGASLLVLPLALGVAVLDGLRFRAAEPSPAPGLAVGATLDAVASQPNPVVPGHDPQASAHHR